LKTLWMFFCILVIALITAMFAVVNVSPVLVHLVFVDTELPLIVIILSSTLLGGLIVGLIGMIKQYKLKRTNKQLQRQLNELKIELAAAVPVFVSPDVSRVEPAPISPVPDHAPPASL
jgi:putative membrane protein